MNETPTAGILYGFAEGRLTGRQLEQTLHDNGFEVTDAAKADVIISHSGGFLAVPAPRNAKTFMYVGATTFHRPFMGSLREKLLFDYRERKQQKQMGLWLMRGARNWFYIPRFTTCRLAKKYMRKQTTPPMADQTIVVRNQHDPYCDTACVLEWKGVSTYISLPGGHDDIWQNPEPFIEILRNRHGS